MKDNNCFCFVPNWWESHQIEESISPHFLYWPCEMMLEKGFNVEIVTKLDAWQYFGRNVPTDEIYKGIRIKRIPHSLFGLFFSKYMIKKRYKLIHGWSYAYFGERNVWAVSKIKKIPYVFTPQGRWHNNPTNIMEQSIRKLYDCIMSFCDRKTDAIMCLTDYEASQYRERGYTNVVTIPHGIDPKIFNVKPNYEVYEKYNMFDYNNILSVGALFPRKNQHLLIDCLPNVLKEFPNTKLFIVGKAYRPEDQKYELYLKSKVQKLNLKNNVSFLGYIPKSDLINLYLLSDIFVLPTQFEAFGIVFLEAMAAGLPIITTNKQPMKEILDYGRVGKLVNLSTKDLSSSIICLLSDFNERRRLAKLGKLHVEKKYRLDLVKEKLWRLYQEVIG